MSLRFRGVCAEVFVLLAAVCCSSRPRTLEEIPEIRDLTWVRADGLQDSTRLAATAALSGWTLDGRNKVEWLLSRFVKLSDTTTAPRLEMLRLRRGPGSVSFGAAARVIVWTQTMVCRTGASNQTLWLLDSSFREMPLDASSAGAQAWMAEEDSAVKETLRGTCDLIASRHGPERAPIGQVADRVREALALIGQVPADSTVDDATMMFDLSRRSTYEAVLDNLTRVPGIVGHAQALLDTAFENEMVRMTGGVPSRRAPTSRIIDLVNVPGWSIVMLNFSLDDGRLIGLMASPDANGCDRLNEASQQWFGSSGHATRDASDFGWALGQLSIAAQGHRNRTSIEDSRRHQVSGPGYPSIERAWKGHRAAAQFMYYAARRECTFTWDALVVPVPGSE